MTDIDIDAIRRQLPLLRARWEEIQNTARPGLVTDRLICAEQSADDVPTLLRWVEQLARRLERTTTALTEARTHLAARNDEIGRLVAENARVRQERDAHSAVVEAVNSLLAVTDGDSLGDRGIAIPLAEIRRVLGEAREGATR